MSYHLTTNKLIKEYVDAAGKSRFANWFDRLHAQAAEKVIEALCRLQLGNTSNVKSVGAGVYELKVNYGPGYRIYFGYDNQTIIVLLDGGSKKRQSADIEHAKQSWKLYKEHINTSRIFKWH